jgi:hypothetical protein
VVTAINLRANMDYRTEFLPSITGAMWQIAAPQFQGIGTKAT